MLTEDSSREPLEVLAEEYLARRRAGDEPSITEYAERYPELAEQIQELLTTLVMLEEGCAESEGEAEESLLDEFPAEGIGESLGNYRLLRLIGRGGMGVVYEAIQEPLGRHVALKVFPVNRWGDGSHRERFRREAQVAARLHHTNIVPVFDVGADDGVDYYAMQFIDGHGLDQIIRSVRVLRGEQEEPDQIALQLRHRLPGPTSPTDSSELRESGLTSSAARSGAQFHRSVASIGLQAAEALAYAHQQGVLHRDIKPSNLLLDIEDRVWVTDFGLAKTVDSEELTQPGDIVGTLQYMAPERFDGACDHRSDIYGLGVTLYELLTRQPTFAAGDRARLVQLITRSEPVAPRKLEPGTPRDLETVILKAIDKDPARRFQSADDLRQFLSDRPVKARRTPPWEKFWRWCRRNPVVSGLSITLGLLLATVALSAVVVAARLDREKLAAERAWAAEQEAREVAVERLRASYLAQARAVRRSRNAGQSFDAAAALTEAARIRPDLEVRNEAIAWFASPDLRLERQWSGIRVPPLPNLPDVVDFDPEFERYAREETAGVVSVRRVSDDEELVRLPPVSARAVELRFSPRGRYLAVRYWHEPEYELRVWEWRTGRAVVTVAEAGGLGACDISGDESWLAVDRSNGATRVYDLQSGEAVAELVGSVAPTTVRFSPDGHRLAVASWSASGTRIWDFRTGEIPGASFERPTARICWRSDGRLLAAASHGSDAWLWDISAGNETALNTSHRAVSNVAFHPDFGLLATTGPDGKTRLWDSSSGDELLAADGNFIRFSRDGSRLAFQDGMMLGVWAVSTGSACRRLFAGTDVRDPVVDVSISADGRLLAAAGGKGAYLWDLERLTPVATLPIDMTCSVSFHPADGSLMTGGINGLLQRHVQIEENEHGVRVTLSEPTVWPLFDSHETVWNPLRIRFGGLAVDGAGQIIAATLRSGQVRVFEGQTGHFLSERCHDATVSRDGKWIAGAGYYQPVVYVWQDGSGDVIHEIPAAKNSRVAFSPDDRFLVVSDAAEYGFWATETWERTMSVSRERGGEQGGPIAFTPDGAVAALVRSRYLVQLIETASGRELATLEPFHKPAVVDALCISPDGTKLAAACNTDGVLVWDLEQIREQLAAMGLGWESAALESN